MERMQNILNRQLLSIQWCDYIFYSVVNVGERETNIKEKALTEIRHVEYRRVFWNYMDSAFCMFVKFLFMQSNVYRQKLTNWRENMVLHYFSFLIYLFNGTQYCSILVMLSMHTIIIPNLIHKGFLGSSCPFIYHCSPSEIR